MGRSWERHDSTASSAGNEEVSKGKLPGGSEGKCENPEVTNPGTYVYPGGRQFSCDSEVPRSTQTQSGEQYPRNAKCRGGEKAEGGGGGGCGVGDTRREDGEACREEIIRNIAALSLRSETVFIPGICDDDDGDGDGNDTANTSMRVFDVSLSKSGEKTFEIADVEMAEHAGDGEVQEVKGETECIIDEVSRKVSDLSCDTVKDGEAPLGNVKTASESGDDLQTSEGGMKMTSKPEDSDGKRTEEFEGGQCVSEEILPVAEIEIGEELTESDEVCLTQDVPEDCETFPDKNKLLTVQRVKIPCGKPYRVPDYLNPKVLTDKLYVIPGLSRYSPAIVEMCLLKTARRKEKYYRRLAKREEAAKSRNDPIPPSTVEAEVIPAAAEDESATKETHTIHQTIPNFESASKQFISRQMDEFEKRFLLPMMQKSHSDDSK